MRKISILILISVVIGGLSLTSCKKDDTAAKKYLLSKIKLGTSLIEELIYNSSNKLTKVNNYDFLTGTISGYYDIAYNGNNVSSIKEYIDTELGNELLVEVNADNTLKKITFVERDISLVDTSLITVENNSSKQITKMSLYSPAVAIPANLQMYSTFTYTSGNVTSAKYYDANDTLDEKYDNVYDTKNSPFIVSEVGIPYLLYNLLSSGPDIARCLSKNNITTSTYTETGSAPEVTTSTYEYNADNYPVKVTESGFTIYIEYLVK